MLLHSLSLAAKYRYSPGGNHTIEIELALYTSGYVDMVDIVGGKLVPTIKSHLAYPTFKKIALYMFFLLLMLSLVDAVTI